MRNRKLTPLCSKFAKTPSSNNNKKILSESIVNYEEDVVDKIIRMDLQKELKSF